MPFVQLLKSRKLNPQALNWGDLFLRAPSKNTQEGKNLLYNPNNKKIKGKTQEILPS